MAIKNLLKLGTGSDGRGIEKQIGGRSETHEDTRVTEIHGCLSGSPFSAWIELEEEALPITGASVYSTARSHI